MHARHTIVGLALAAAVTAASAQVTFYSQEGFRGQAFTTERQVNNFQRFGFNDQASSAVVTSGRWEVCTDEGFSGDCRVLRKGSYDSLRGMGIGNRISSVRPVKNNRNDVTYAPEPLPQPNYAYRQRPNERLFEAQVTSAAAVFGAPEQRCWVEREQVQSQNNNVNVPGAIIGGIIGGVLGHQVGGGRGQDVATGVGAVGGAVVGSNIGSGGGGSYTRDVQKCAAVPTSSVPAYWDVSYEFRGQQHRVQLATQPGPTITVNRDGEPRG